MTDFRIAFPFTKIDEEKREVYGFATLEKLDQQGEIVSYDASKEAFAEWSDRFVTHTNGKSAGNIREMHEPKPVGKLIDWEADDSKKAIWVGAKISETADDTWKKIKEAVLTGFSIGANYAEREPVEIDGKFANRIKKYKMAELSLVDNPACPGATIELIKGAVCSADLVEKRRGGKTETQTVILSKERFKTRASATAWAKENDYQYGKVDETEDSWRLRQKEPGAFEAESFRTVELSDGISIVVGHPKGHKEATMEVKKQQHDPIPQAKPPETTSQYPQQVVQKPSAPEKKFELDFTGQLPPELRAKVAEAVNQAVSEVMSKYIEKGKIMPDEKVKKNADAEADADAEARKEAESQSEAESAAATGAQAESEAEAEAEAVPRGEYCAYCGSAFADDRGEDEDMYHHECAVKARERMKKEKLEGMPPTSPVPTTPPGSKEHPAEGAPTSIKTVIATLKKRGNKDNLQVAKALEVLSAANEKAAKENLELRKRLEKIEKSPRTIVGPGREYQDAEKLAGQQKVENAIDGMMAKAAKLDPAERAILEKEAVKMSVIAANREQMKR